GSAATETVGRSLLASLMALGDKAHDCRRDAPGDSKRFSALNGPGSSPVRPASCAMSTLQRNWHRMPCFGVTVAAGRMDCCRCFQKSEIPCRIGKASFVLRAWIGNSWGARIMSQRAWTAEGEIQVL